LFSLPPAAFTAAINQFGSEDTRNRLSIFYQRQDEEENDGVAEKDNESAPTNIQEDSDR